MKNPKLNDYLLWKGKPAQVIGETDRRQVIIELLENRKCPHCQGDLGKEQIHMIVSSPLFQQNADQMPTIQDESFIVKDRCGIKGCFEPIYEFGTCFKHHCQSEPM